MQVSPDEARRLESGRRDMSTLIDKLDKTNVLSMLLFGSTARGDDTADSDYDLLIVTNEESSKRSLVKNMSDASTSRQLNVLIVTPDGLFTELTTRPSFIAHLLDEGQVLYETPAWEPIRIRLEERALDPSGLQREVRKRQGDLQFLTQLDRFAESPITLRSHVYSTVRALVIARLLQAGIHEYSWRRAFDRYAELRPELSLDLDTAKSLRPYYDFARARTQEPPGEQSVGDSEIRELIDSIVQ